MVTDRAWLDWIKTLPADRDIKAIADTIRVHPCLVVGWLVALWSRYDEHDKPLPATEVDELTRLPGFARALVETGWAVPCFGGLEFTYFEQCRKDQQKARRRGKANVERHRDRERKAEQAIAIYEAYPLQVGRARAVMEIRIALDKVDYDTLLRKTQEFKESVAHLKGKERKKICHAATWYREERWDDRPEDRFTAKTQTDRPGRVESYE